MAPQHAPREGGGHRPVECVCGSTFTRPDGLERHIASMNKIVKASCLLCQHDQPPKTFSRLDHLHQHLRTFHKIPAGRIPDDFAARFARDATTEECMPPQPPQPPPQPMASYPCPVPGCVKTGGSAYLRQIDLDEHMAWMHGPLQNDMPTQQGLTNPSISWANGGFQQNPFWQPAPIFGQYVQPGQFLQPHSTRHFRADGGYMGNDVFGRGDPNIEQNEEFNMDFEMGFGPSR
ncbi:hypothetical protein GGR51DRAFT_571248 [Nemania sp. FL0031]|nr:hypothetical protein GGR51DRAFT_571248 [Nemania sp. FL0031]